MPNVFSTKELVKSISNYPVSKGAQPGHPFEGNQYTSGQGQALSDKANDLVDASKPPVHGELSYAPYKELPSHATLRDGHTELSHAHAILARNLYDDASRAGGQDATLARNLTKLAELHSRASQTHALAALAHNVAARSGRSDGSGDLADLMSTVAAGASDDARHAEAELSKPTPASGYNPITGHVLAL